MPDVIVALISPPVFRRMAVILASPLSMAAYRGVQPEVSASLTSAPHAMSSLGDIMVADQCRIEEQGVSVLVLCVDGTPAAECGDELTARLILLSRIGCCFRMG